MFSGVSLSSPGEDSAAAKEEKNMALTADINNPC